MLWASYIIAIYKKPGSPPSDFEPRPGQWRKWCKKCNCYKPERAHHCKTCGVCVLKMDHHCEYLLRLFRKQASRYWHRNLGPWTANCVGHYNMPHFLRFLLWVVWTNGFCLYYLLKRDKSYWDDRHLPSYLISKTSLTMAIVLTPLAILVEVSVGVLAIRCFYHILSSGMTQIECWEYERLEEQCENGKLYPILRDNYRKLFGKDLKSYTSWSMTPQVLRDSMDESDYAQFGIDDIIFPYDLGPWSNLIHAFGHPYKWILPFAGPIGDGLTFPVNEYVEPEDDLSSMPWPPDGWHQDKDSDATIDQQSDQFFDENERVIRRRKTGAVRSQWENRYGESLADFGVDMDSELWSLAIIQKYQ